MPEHQLLPSGSPRSQSVVSCYSAGEVDQWPSPPRSASPSTASTHSGNSSSSSSYSEVGDSGVCSEHDTPPPVTRYPRVKPHINSSDSESEGNVSSDSLPETTTYRSTRQWSPATPPSGVKIHKLQSQNYKVAKSKIPDALLKEIKYKWEEIQDRRRRQRALGGVCTTGTADRGHIRVSSSWSSIHPGRSPCPPSTTPSSPTLSRASSSNFPSTLSLFVEDEGEMMRTSSFTVESWRRAGNEGGDKASLYECRDLNGASSSFAGIRDIFSPQQESTIKSYKGTVRGVKNRVRAGIATFTSDQRLLKHLQDRERGKVVVYVTTLGIVRSTYERCLRIRKILWTLLVRFDERDVFMARDTQIQLMDRTHKRHVTVPHVFLEGQYLGDAEQIEMMNESGELRRLLAQYRTESVTSTCNTCGGFRLLPCSVCRGSKKSVHRNDFTLEFVALKCSSCDESGLVKCEDCNQFKELDKAVDH
ncbi:unnamed protein product, partial [Meganyctiphanes norvegica]